MNDERVVEEIVTEFFLNTCPRRPQFSMHAVQAVVHCVQIAAQHPVNEEEADLIPLTTGSAAEFYIEPMLPHIGDVDVMFHQSTQLAIPRGHPPPTQLPAEFHNCVRVFEIIDSHLTGYVYLKLRYLLTECDDDSKYNAVEYDEHNVYLTNRWHTGNPDYLHGPAVLRVYSDPALSHDAVLCVRCLVWPTQAADWPTRHRNYNWPDSATVDRVVNNGCDVVGVAHRQCRQHEVMGKRQHRLSFSRAEIVLINSWMPVQQIVYHMLRVFVKTERLTDGADNAGAGTLSNYHIKTLMLWACELWSQTWWTDDLSLVRICVTLLHILGDWLTDAWCEHYFINNCNLVDNLLNVTYIGSKLMSIDVTWLSKWFLDNNIRKCSELCPNTVFRLFDDVITTMKLRDAVSTVVAWRLNNSELKLWHAFEFAQYSITTTMNYLSHLLSARSFACWMTELTKIDSGLCVYFTAVAFLHVAYKSSKRGLYDELMDVLATMFGQVDRVRQYSYNISLLSLNKAANVMKFVAKKSPSTMSLIAIELSKAYLHRALRCKDSQSDSIYCLANVYLAVLYYITGQYQTAIDHCTLVMRSQDHSQCSSHVVQGELLPKIDDDVDNMLGLAVFYQYIQAAALNQQCSARHVSVLTTELFAYYLHIKYFLLHMCHYLMQTSSTDEVKRYEIRLSDTVQLFVGDVLLFVSLSRSLKQKTCQKLVFRELCQSATKPLERNRSDLGNLLQKSAVKHLTSFRQIQARDFGSVRTIVTTDFEALYAYKVGDYHHCLQLSTQNVRTLLNAKHVTVTSIMILMIYPEFIQLLDDDIVSLTALTAIVYRQSRLYGASAGISQLTLSLYLMTQCQLKIRHSVTSLAQTLGYIKNARKRHPPDFILDHLSLKLIERKIMSCVEHCS